MSSAITLGSLGTPEDKRSGFTLTEIFGRNFLEVGTPNYRPEILAEFFLRFGTPSEFEIKKSLTQNCVV